MAGHLVEPVLWNDSKYRTLTVGGRLLFVALLTGPQRMRLPGLQVVSTAQLADILPAEEKEVELWLRELALCKMVEVDEEHRIMRLPNAPKYASCPNPKVLWSWYRQWCDLPDRSGLKWAHLDTLWLAIPPKTSTTVRAWNASFAHVADAFREGVTLSEIAHTAKSVTAHDVLPAKGEKPSTAPRLKRVNGIGYRIGYGISEGLDGIRYPIPYPKSAFFSNTVSGGDTVSKPYTGVEESETSDSNQIDRSAVSEEANDTVDPDLDPDPDPDPRGGVQGGTTSGVTDPQGVAGADDSRDFGGPAGPAASGSRGRTGENSGSYPSGGRPGGVGSEAPELPDFDPDGAD